MTRSRSRRLQVAGLAATLVALVGVVGGAASGAAVHGARGQDVPVQTRPVCGPVSGRHVRCAAVQVLNPDALGRKVHDSRHRATTTTTRASTTTSTSSTTTSTSTSTTSTSTTTSVPGPTTSTTSVGSTSCTTAHAGLTPCDLRGAYALPSSAAGAGETVAIVDAYNDPNAEADLGTYRAAYGLSACTTTNGCFHKVDQNGGANYPSANTGWAEEISLDLDMVSAACPNCHILLVEANSNNLSDLLTAEQAAAALGANAISNSWAANEFSYETLYDSYFNLKIPITASSGDSGYGVGWPAASPYVTAVGGTSLTRATNARGWSETAWSGSGSGCSAYETKPAWQTDTGCPNRTVADVSAVADPNTGVATYDSYNASGWLVFGGTSVAAPIIASVYALAANGATITSPAYAYAHPSALFDVTSGTNGNCGGSYLCTARPGYDGPTGLGTPDGTAAF
jgi:subtilase family serine protease